MKGQRHTPFSTCRIEKGQKWKLEKKNLKNGNHQLCLRIKNFLHLYNRKKQTKRKIKQDHIFLFLPLVSAYAKLLIKVVFFAPFLVSLFLFFFLHWNYNQLTVLVLQHYHFTSNTTCKKLILHVSAKYVFCLRHGKVNVRLHIFPVFSVNAEKESLPLFNIIDIIMLHHKFFTESEFSKHKLQ